MNVPAISRWRTLLCRLPRFSGGPGEVTLAATNAASSGTGRSGMRVFGQWALVYSVSGRCLYEDERGARQELEPGSWILVFPEMAQSYGPPPGERWNEIYVCFRGPVFEAWRTAGSFDPSRPIGRWLPPAQGLQLFRKFFREIQKKGCSSLKAVCLWQELLAEIVGVPQEPGAKREEWLEQSLDLLEHADLSNGSNSLRKAAQSCGMGYESFRKKFEGAMGMPPGHYVLTRRVERARKLLSLQSLTNMEIASMLGFYDEYHFSRTFTKFTGSSPREFRKEARKQ